MTNARELSLFDFILFCVVFFGILLTVEINWMCCMGKKEKNNPSSLWQLSP